MNKLENTEQTIDLEGDLDTKSALNNNNKNTLASSMKSSSSLPLNIEMFTASIPNLNLTQMKPTEWIAKRRETLKPWGEFFSTGRFKKPTGVSQSTSRLIKNIEYFQSNYLFVFIGLAVYCILTSPYLLFALFAFIGACYILHLKNKDGKLKVMGKELSLAQLYTGAGMLSIPLFLFAGASSAVFWIIGASLFIIVLHAVFYSRDELDDPFLPQMNTV